MNEVSIEALLAKRGAWLKGDSGNTAEANEHAPLTRMISANYQLFEEVRNRVFTATEAFMRHVEILPDTLSDAGHAMVAEMLARSLVIREEHGHAICEVKGRRYLSEIGRAHV